MKNNFVLIFMFGLVLIPTAQAETCAQYLKSSYKADVVLAIGFPVLGWFAGMISADIINNKLHDSRRLKAATILINRTHDQERQERASRLMDSFYQKLLRKYPTMRLGKQEVVDLLHRFNMNSVGEGKCYHFLARYLFPDNRAQNYIAGEEKALARNIDAAKVAKKKKEQYEKDLIEARKVRAEKNGIEEVQYFDDL